MNGRTQLRPAARSWFRSALTLGLLGVVVFCAGYFCAAQGQGTRAQAQPPVPQTAEPVVPAASEPTPEYSNRVVAYINGTQAITREDLGEYLIARYGAEKLELLVNKRIIDEAARKAGITVTAADVDGSLSADCGQLGIDRATFVNQVLKQYGKTLFEWKEDVIRPRLLLTRLCRDRITVKEEELKEAFDMYHGEKVDARIILFPPGSASDKVQMQIWAKIRDSDDEFDRAARQQANPSLAATAGKVKPISRHIDNPQVEKAAFSLQPGEVSELIHTKEGNIIIKCVGRVPPDATRSLDKERDTLRKEVVEKKLQKAIPEEFARLKEQAQPKVFMQQQQTEKKLKEEVQQNIKDLDKVLTPKAQ